MLNLVLKPQALLTKIQQWGVRHIRGLCTCTTIRTSFSLISPASRSCSSSFWSSWTCSVSYLCSPPSLRSSTWDFSCEMWFIWSCTFFCSAILSCVSSCQIEKQNSLMLLVFRINFCWFLFSKIGNQILFLFLTYFFKIFQIFQFLFQLVYLFVG